jgi:hypothetical protein
VVGKMVVGYMYSARYGCSNADFFFWTHMIRKTFGHNTGIQAVHTNKTRWTFGRV